MQNPLFLDSSTPRGSRFHKHLSRSTSSDLKQGLFDTSGYCSLCHVMSPHHHDKITCHLCRRIFHTPCLADRISRSTVGEISRTPSLWWFCLECLKVTNSVRTCVLASENRNNNRRMMSAKPEKKREKDVDDGVIREIKSEIYTQLKSEMEERLTEISNNISRTTSTVSVFSDDIQKDGGSEEDSVQTNGQTNGETNGQTNEQTFSRGQTNERRDFDTNGHTNGFTNKQTNGHTTNPETPQKRLVFSPKSIRKTGSTGCLVFESTPSPNPPNHSFEYQQQDHQHRPKIRSKPASSSSSSSENSYYHGLLSPAQSRRREKNNCGLSEIRNMMERARDTTREMM